MFESKTSLRRDNETLREEITNLQDSLTYAREQQRSAEIALQRSDTNHRVELQNVVTNWEIKVAQLTRELTVFKSNFDETLADAVTDAENNSLRELDKEKVNLRKEMKAEYADKVEKLTAENKKLSTDNEKNAGLYAGSLLVIKALEEQLGTANTLNTTLVTALGKGIATVSAEITTPEINVAGAPRQEQKK